MGHYFEVPSKIKNTDVISPQVDGSGCERETWVLMSDMELSEKVFNLAHKPAELKVFLAEHPEVKVDLYKSGGGYTALLISSMRESSTDSVSLLLDHKADVNAQASTGSTPLMIALMYCVEENALVLLESGADVHIKNQFGWDALYYTIKGQDEHMPFVLLCCGADAKNVSLNHQAVTQAQVDAAIAEYKNTQAFIENYHELLEHTLSTQAEVDTRMCLRSTGIYQEPLERTLEYLGLSMNHDQVVNTSIDGTTPVRVLIPNHPRNAKHWYNKFKAWTIHQQEQQQ
jgi:hypothetical protein